ncbi:MAG: AtpZ/AtpI family protein [Lachnospiraceae bacterium]|nr:AtpZ/AtpI family protein [Lachnospiraceae bacterium]
MRKDLSKIFKNLTLLTQLGLSLIMPLLMCLAFCWYLTYRFNVGVWVYIVGFFFGLGASFMTAYKFYVSQSNKSKKGTKNKVSFNRHA